MILFYLFLICYLVLAWRRLDYAAIFLLAALPSYLIRSQILSIPVTLLEVMILVSFAVWLVRFTDFLSYLTGKKRMSELLSARKQRIAYPYAVEISILLLVSFFSVGIAHFSDQSLGIWKAYFFEPLLFYVFILNLFRLSGSKERMTFDKVIFGLAISAFAVSVLAIYQKMTGDLIFNDFWAKEPGRRAVSFFGYPNAISLFVGPLIPLFAGWVVNAVKSGIRQLSRQQLLLSIFVSLTIVLSGLAICAARSEGAAIGLAAALLVWLLMSNQKTRIAAIILAILAAAMIMIVPAVKTKAVNYATLNNFSGNVRRAQWSETWKMFTDGNLIFGAGLANYQTAIKPYHVAGFFFNKDNDPDFRRKIVLFNDEYKKKYWQPLEIYLYPHNLILNFWSELGLVGMLLFVWVIIKYIFTALRLLWQKNEAKYLVIGLLSAMIVIAVHGQVDVPYFKNDLSVIFWLLVALLSLVRLEQTFQSQDADK